MSQHVSNMLDNARFKASCSSRIAFDSDQILKLIDSFEELAKLKILRFHESQVETIACVLQLGLPYTLRCGSCLQQVRKIL